FESLGREHLAKIIDLQLQQLAKRLADRHMTVGFGDKARQVLIDEGYDPVYGARPLKRTIQRRVLDPLALQVLEGRFREGDTIIVETDGSGLTFRAAEREPEEPAVMAGA